MLNADFLEPERLRAFVVVAETRSFTKAARRLHLTQPAVSIQVRRLEESVGRRLLERRGQVASLTKEGEAMLGYAHELLSTAERRTSDFLWHFNFNRALQVNEQLVAGREEIYFGHQFATTAGSPEAVPAYAHEF